MRVDVMKERTRQQVNTFVLTMVCLLSASCNFSSSTSDNKSVGPPRSGTPRPEALPQECPVPTEVPKALRFGATPYAGPEVLKEQFEPIVNYLSESLERPVQLVPTDSYGALLDQLERGEVDLVSLSPLTYVRAKERMPCLQQMVMQVTNGSTYYSSHIVVRQDAPLASMKDLKGKRMAFVSKDSTSGYLFPVAYLQENGIDVENYFGEVVFAGDHLRAIDMLLAGEVDATATFSNIFSPARADGIDVGALRVLAITGRIPYDAVCARPGLDRKLVEEVALHLFHLNSTTAEGRANLRKVVVDINGWIYTRDSEYDSVRINQRRVNAAEGSL